MARGKWKGKGKTNWNWLYIVWRVRLGMKIINCGEDLVQKGKVRLKKIISEMMKVQDVDGYNMIYHFPHLDFHIKTHGIFL